MFINKTSNQSFSIDSRTSDAIAIAIRFNAGIYTYKHILDKSQNYIHEIDEPNKKKKLERELTKKSEIIPESLDELEKKLNLAIQEENYELAAKIRDQIKKLK